MHIRVEKPPGASDRHGRTKQCLYPIACALRALLGCLFELVVPGRKLKRKEGVMYFWRNLTLVPLGLLIAVIFLNILTDGAFPRLLNWVLFVFIVTAVLGGSLVGYYFRCKVCGKRPLIVDDGDLFGKRNYFACRCMNCGAPLKGQ
ncbi:hypothetical protein EII18_00095 [Comamonadaceae bacterium OH3737_COT-264]|nr:hypothetical protein EII18_00095 [Comamonadaceae bacterium OH3737_COT-264]